MFFLTPGSVNTTPIELKHLFVMGGFIHQESTCFHKTLSRSSRDFVFAPREIGSGDLHEPPLELRAAAGRRQLPQCQVREPLSWGEMKIERWGNSSDVSREEEN